MKMYEFLYIIPSRYAENEIEGVAKTVTGMVERAGGSIVKTTVLGRLKLAYPIKGSRYGTYVLTFFEAEPAAMAALDRALSLCDEVLRHTILSAKPGDEKKKAELTAYVAPLSEEAREERADRRPAPSRAPAPVLSAAPAAVKVGEPAMSIEELDKKLDEILDTDVTKGI
ncbi:30S ribosomal protein S6 [Candidatus Uhrbacteria bacterium RIFCSPHIGHO2_01_FULL_63_20]|uniref:Small ribosomal subunit protein bS6 n=1 Tax=Candidatus Uhrbacteria bacterium RIFCSPHIGHO2_01_FULL_63_20 TaxID=1802385 RepID=A0A1F7TP36_9BACT|nr:MAG: 30S ribosomal protein S6 [Candidatus Uhrbacteria bacterium RIFCSPHIGHO2_01_FULL_63_20]